MQPGQNGHGPAAEQVLLCEVMGPPLPMQWTVPRRVPIEGTPHVWIKMMTPGHALSGYMDLGGAERLENQLRAARLGLVLPT